MEVVVQQPIHSLPQYGLVSDIPTSTPGKDRTFLYLDLEGCVWIVTCIYAYSASLKLDSHLSYLLNG